MLFAGDPAHMAALALQNGRNLDSQMQSVPKVGDEKREKNSYSKISAESTAKVSFRCTQMISEEIENKSNLIAQTIDSERAKFAAKKCGSFPKTLNLALYKKPLLTSYESGFFLFSSTALFAMFIGMARIEHVICTTANSVNICVLKRAHT